MSALALLMLRRALPRALVAAALALALACALRDFGASAELAQALGGAPSAAAAARAATWTCALALIAPAMVARAASTLGRWRRADREWLAPRAAPPRAFLAAALAGPVIGGLALALAFLAAAELAAGAGPQPALADAGLARHAPLALLAERTSGTVALSTARAPSRGARLRGRVVLLPGEGQGADVRVAVRSGGRVVGSTRVAAGADPRFEVALEPSASDAGVLEPLASDAGVLEPSASDAGVLEPLASDAGALELALERAPGGAAVLLPGDSVRLCAPAASARRASAALAARLALFLIAACGLALGLGAWMRPSLAALLALALWLLALASPAARALAPGADLGEALALAGEGVAPAWPGVARAAAAAAIAALGLALARLGLRSAGGAA